MKPSPTFLAAGCLLLACAGCGPGGKIAAVVNGQVITEKDLESRIARLRALPNRSPQSDDHQRVLEDLVTETVLVQEAQRRRLDRDSEVQRLLAEARRQILVGRFLETLAKENPVEATSEEVGQFYQQHSDRFTEPEMLRASHILVKTEEEAKKGLNRLKSGEPFAKVAEELSIDPTRVRGGDIGFFSPGQVIPEFEEQCRRLKAGQLSGIVKTSFGYHLILLTDHRPARQRPLEEVEDQIKKQLTAQRQQRQVAEKVQQVRSKAQVQIREPVSLASSVLNPPQPSSAPNSTPYSGD